MSPKGTGLASFRGHHLSSPKHLRHSVKSIATSLALRRDRSADSQSPLSPQRPRSPSLTLRRSSFGSFEGFSAEAQMDTSVNCTVSAPCSPSSPLVSRCNQKALRLDLSCMSPRADLSSFRSEHLSSPTHSKRSPKTLLSSVMLRKNMLAGYSPYKGNTINSPLDSPVKQTSPARRNEREKRFDDDTVFLYQPRPIRKSLPQMERIIRNPICRLQHGNRNYYDFVAHTWRPSGAPLPGAAPH